MRRLGGILGGERLLAVLAPLALGLLAGCDQSLSTAAGAGDDPPALSPDTSSFLALVPDAPFNVAYRGERLVDLRYQGQVLYKEDVGSDGQGKFAVITLDVISPQTDEDLFRLIQDGRQVQTYRMRDFRIRDYDLFLQNYTVQVNDPATEVAGVACVQLEVRRASSAAKSYYLVDIDPANGLVMRWEEYDFFGSLLARVEFVDFTLDGDVSDMVLVDRVFETESFDLDTTDFQALVGFEPLVPTFPPDAQLQVSPVVERLMVDGEPWLKVYLSDGADQAILMHGAPDETPLGQRGTVESLEVASWCALRGTVKGYPIVMAGKFPQDDLALALQSALED